MLIHLHKQATTTPKIRAAIQASDDAGTVLSERFGVVVGAPGGERGAGMMRGRELVQEFVPQAAVKALDKGILGGVGKTWGSRVKRLARTA